MAKNVMSTFDQFPAWADKLKSTQVHPTEPPKVQPMPIISFSAPPHQITEVEQAALERALGKSVRFIDEIAPPARKGWPKGKPRKVK